MTTQKAIKAITDFREVAYGHAVLSEALDMAIKALQQGCEKVAEGCDDLIRRQDAIDAIWDGINYDIYTREVKEILEDLPSVRPEKSTTDEKSQLAEENSTRKLIYLDDAVEAIEMLLEQSEDDEHDTTWNNAIRGAINAVKHHTKSAQPDNRLTEIAGLVEGTIDHFNLEDAMDLLYQIKAVLR